MLLGRSVRLGYAEQLKVTQWIILKSMVFEQEDPLGVIFTREETLEFSRSRTVPPGIRIWLFKTRGVGRNADAAMAYAQMGEELGPVFERANVKTLYLRIGKLVVYILYSKVEAVRHGGFPPQISKNLWPQEGRYLHWPPVGNIGAADQEHIKGMLGRFLANLEA